MIAAATLRLYYLQLEIFSFDPTLQAAYVTFWTQIQLDYGIMASTLSGLGSFLAPFEKEPSPAGYDVKLSSVASTTHNKKMTEPQVMLKGILTLRRDVFLSGAEISHDTTSDHRSIATNDSKQMIIKKKVDWRVESYGRSENELLS